MSAIHPIITFRGRKIAVDVPHLAFATGIAGWAAWFCLDAWRASSDVENLILIVPISAAAVILYMFVVAGCLQISDDAASVETLPRTALGPGVGFKIAGCMILLAGFVVAGPLVGFDISSFIYLLATIAFLGERRFLVLLLLPLIFCVVVIYSFSSLLATPLRLFFFPGYGS